MKDRIAHILKIKNLTATRFADELEVQRSGISHILSGRNKPSLDFIIKIKDTYPEFSLDWLILGKGPATISPSSVDHNKPDKSYSLFDEETDLREERGSNQARSEIQTDQSQQETDHAETKAQKGKPQVKIAESFDPSVATSIDDTGIERVMLFYTDKTFEIYRPKR